MNGRIQPGTDYIRARHIKRQQQHIRMMKRRRIIFFSVLSVIVIIIVLFFTPLFNIKSINISGNSKIDAAVIKQAIGSVEEENLFRLDKKKIIKNIKEIPYADDAQIKKTVFPVGLEVTVKECIPVCYMPYKEEYAILDKNFRVLEITGTPFEGISEIAGIGVVSATPAAILSPDDNDKQATAIECIASLIDHNIMSGVVKIDFSDTNNIVFNYENRLNVLCGSSVDFSKKISMFTKAVTSSKLNENSRGTIDIYSISGKAIYTP